MLITVNTLRRLAAPEGVAMENHFFEHFLKRMVLAIRRLEALRS
jgi:hypothetical protein